MKIVAGERLWPGQLVYLRRTQEGAIEAFALRSPGRHNGVAARHIEEGEKIEYEPLGNTSDIVTRAPCRDVLI